MMDGVVAANNNCIPAHTGGTGSLIILHGGGGGGGGGPPAGRAGPKHDPQRLADTLHSHDLRLPAGPETSANDVLSTLTELKPVQTYAQQPPDYLSPYPTPYDGTSTRTHFLETREIRKTIKKE